MSNQRQSAALDAARALDAEADQCASLRRFLCTVPQKERLGDAAVLYARAATQYLIANAREQAAAAFAKAADAHANAEQQHYEAACMLVKAARAVQPCSVASAVAYWKRAAAAFADQGYFSRAASVHSEIAKQMERDGAVGEALQHWQHAVDNYEHDQADSRQADACRIQRAMLLARKQQRFADAAQLFEHVALPLLCRDDAARWTANKHCLHNILCHLANGDAVNAQRSLRRFCAHPAFESSSECAIAQRAIDAAENDDAAHFWRAAPVQDSFTLHLLQQVESNCSFNAIDRKESKGKHEASSNDDSDDGVLLNIR